LRPQDDGQEGVSFLGVRFRKALRQRSSVGEEDVKDTRSATGTVFRFEGGPHGATPDLQRGLDRPRRDPADELCTRPGAGL